MNDGRRGTNSGVALVNMEAQYAKEISLVGTTGRYTAREHGSDHVSSG